MRNANWYYENYFIQKRLADSRGVSLTDLNKVADNMNTELQGWASKYNSALLAKKTWTHIALIAGGLVAVETAYIVLKR